MVVDDVALFGSKRAVTDCQVAQLFAREKWRWLPFRIAPAILFRDRVYAGDIRFLHPLHAEVDAADEFLIVLDLPDPFRELALEVAIRLVALQRIDLRLELRDLGVALDDFEPRIDQVDTVVDCL